MRASVLEWLEESSLKYADKPAVCDEWESYTYKQYHDKAIGIAEAIIATGMGSKKPIVVYLNKSVKVLASFMGIAYSGNFYSPIDVDMPGQRVNRILEVLEPELVITTKELQKEFQDFDYSGKYLIYEEISPLAESDTVKQVQSRIIDTDLLYVLFTSGSTGMPKGVCITHRAVIDFADWATETFSVTSQERFGNQAPFYFDNSVFDIYSTMKTGATLYIIPKALFMQPVRLLEYLKNNRINSIFWVPSAMMVVSKLKAFRNADLTDTLTRVLFAGEVMPNKQLNIWRKYLPDVLYANLYGPTEITDICTYYIVDREFADEESLPIGIPTKNMDVMILDEEDRLVTTPGVVGELCIRGTGVSTGYYKNPERTAQSFVQNPLNHAYEEKIYRSGDLVEYNEYYEIMYLSRKDFQIKHLGHRIELGEIETAVSSLPDVTMNCCLYDEKRSRIVLFLDRDMSKEEVNNRLTKLVPEYMLPGKVIFMEEMPLNGNGKIDRVALREFL